MKKRNKKSTKKKTKINKQCNLNEISNVTK